MGRKTNSKSGNFFLLMRKELFLILYIDGSNLLLSPENQYKFKRDLGVNLPY